MLYNLIFAQDFLSNPLFYALQAVALIIAVVISLSLHEFSHGLMAHWFGDDTAKNSGRLSLNPIVHLDPLGFLMLLIAPFGWAKPVPVNYYNLRRPKLGILMVSIAGPLSNLVFGTVFGFLALWIYPILGDGNLLPAFFFYLMIINFALLIFNLIPIPPLDGSKALFALLPDRFNDFKEKFTIYGPTILLILVLGDAFLNINILSGIFGYFYQLLFRLFGF